jgi:flagellar motor switch protein FliM
VSSETLSQNEIDLLFSEGAESSSTDAPSDEGDSGVQLYDFRRPNLISKDRLRALDALYGMLCKSLESWLTQRVRGPIEIRLLGIEHFSYGEFTLSLPNPTASYVFEAGSGQQVVIDFGRDFAFYLVDRLLGSNGPPPTPDRALTVVERMVVKIPAEYVAGQLDEIWKDYVKLGLRMNRFESVPEILRTANREDPMLVAHIEARANNLSGTLLLCLPFNVLEKFFTATPQRLTHGRDRSESHGQDRVAAEASLLSTNVMLSVRTPDVQLPIGAIPTIQPGSTLLTGLPSGVQLPVLIEDQVRFLVQPGRAGRTLAVRVIDVFDGADTRAEQIARSMIMATVSNDASAGGLDLAELQAAGQKGGSSLNSLFTLTLPVTIELGRARMSIQEVLELGRGSVIPLERLVGEPVDVLVGDRRFAEGEVVVIGEQFGVRITRMVQQPTGAEALP